MTNRLQIYFPDSLLTKNSKSIFLLILKKLREFIALELVHLPKSKILSHKFI